MDSEGSALATSETGAIAVPQTQSVTVADSEVSSGGLQGQRFNAGDTFGRMNARDAVEYFSGLPAELWTQIIDRRTANYAPPSYANHFYVNTNVALGIMSFFHEGMVGEASLIRAANDWQRIGLNNEGHKISPHPYGAEVGQNWWDDLMAQAGGITNRSPEAQAEHLINAVNLVIDKTVFLGDRQVGKWGVRDNPLIGRVAASGRFTDDGMTPYDLVQLILQQRERCAIVNDEEDASENTVPNALIVPTTTMQYFQRPVSFRLPGGTEELTTIEAQLQAGGISYIGASRWMTRTSSTGGRAALLYRRDQGETAATQVYQPMTLERLPIHNNGHENVLKMFSVLYDLWFSLPSQTVLIENI
jgi:hypothetical protein